MAAYEGNSARFLLAVTSDAEARAGAVASVAAGRNLPPFLSDIPTSAGLVVAK